MTSCIAGNCCVEQAHNVNSVAMKLEILAEVNKILMFKSEIAKAYNISKSILFTAY